MKIGVISDTHGSLTAWRKAFNRYFADADLIVHCGDLFYHGPRNPLPDGYAGLPLAEALNGCRVPLIIARGNCDSEVDVSLLKWPVAAPFCVCRVEGKTILAWHEGEVAPEAAAARERFKPEVFIVGHTHRPRLWTAGPTLCLNPGSPSLSKLPDGRGTVGLLDDRGAHILELDTGKEWAAQPWAGEGS